MRPSRAVALLAAALLALAASIVLDRRAPPPNAETAGGSEEAFASGLLPRMVLREGPMRWTSGVAVFRFEHLPPGPLGLEVRIHGQRGPVTVLAPEGSVVGVIDRNASGGEYRLAPGAPSGRLDVVLEFAPFTLDPEAGPRGALLDRVRVTHAPASRFSWTLALVFVLPALSLCLGALAAGLPPLAATSTAGVVTLAQALLLWPQGLVRSGYSWTLAWTLVACGALGALVARAAGRRFAGAGPWAFAALVAAVLVQGIAATSPLMLVSDAVFHSKRLGDAAAGELFPTSVTQHAQPFRFPYGISFYLSLVPFAWAGLDRVELVRAGAAVASLLASAALFMLVARDGAAQAGLAVLLLQLLPATFEPFSYGNLSNVFGQAMTVIFFAWWAGPAPGGWVVGALALAFAALGHLSSLIVVAIVVAALIVARRGLQGDRTRGLALAAGFAIAVVYYGRFAPLIVEQLPRLLEGGGLGRASSRSGLDALRLQLLWAWHGFGAPALLLAAIGLLRWRSLDRELLAYAAGCALLAVPAVVSPLEVRYLYALTLPVAVAAGRGAWILWGSGWKGRGATIMLVLVQSWLAGRTLVEAMIERYRV